MSIYFTSDLHIGHDKDFLYKPRGFNNVWDMDNAIIENITHTLTHEDYLYILGDICMGGKIMQAEWNRVLHSIPCKTYFIIGNHDTDNKIEYYKSLGFECLGYANVFKYSKHKRFYISHYPTIVTNMDDPKFIWNLSGHTHDKDIFSSYYPKIYNVALDAHNCQLVNIETIISDIEKYNKEI